MTVEMMVMNLSALVVKNIRNILPATTARNAHHCTSWTTLEHVQSTRITPVPDQKNPRVQHMEN